MNIAIDGNEANVQNRVGSNVYAFEILTELSKLTKGSSTHVVTVLLSSSPVKDLPRSRNNWRYKIIGPKPLWTQWGLPLHLFLHKDSYDVFFTPGHYAPRISVIPYVSSVMDLAFLEYPKQFKKRDLLQLTNWTKYSVKHAAKVIAISEYTKQAVIHQYQKNQFDVFVAPPAVRPPKISSSKQAEQVAKKFDITSPYIIHVGTIQPRKNIERLVEAFEKIRRKQAATNTTSRNSRRPNKYQLVLVGKVGWLADPILERIKRSPFSKDIIITGYTAEAEKQALLQYAECSVHLGLYEGFGIPALEAMYAGTIPVVAKTTSLPEVVGDAGITADPQSVSSIAAAIAFVLNLSAKDRGALRKAGRTQRQMFNWKNSAEIILTTLTEVGTTHA